MIQNPEVQNLVLVLLNEHAGLAIRGIVSEAVSRTYTKKILDLVNLQVMTRKETAAFLGISVRTLDRFVKEEGLPHELRQLQRGKRPQRVFVLGDVLKWQHNRFIGLLPEEVMDE